MPYHNTLVMDGARKVGPLALSLRVAPLSKVLS